MANVERRTIAGAEMGGGLFFIVAAVSGGFSVAAVLEAIVGAGLVIDGKNRWSRNDENQKS